MSKVGIIVWRDISGQIVSWERWSAEAEFKKKISLRQKHFQAKKPGK